MSPAASPGRVDSRRHRRSVPEIPGPGQLSSGAHRGPILAERWDGRRARTGRRVPHRGCATCDRKGLRSKGRAAEVTREEDRCRADANGSSRAWTFATSRSRPYRPTSTCSAWVGRTSPDHLPPVGLATVGRRRAGRAAGHALGPGQLQPELDEDDDCRQFVVQLGWPNERRRAGRAPPARIRRRTVASPS